MRTRTTVAAVLLLLAAGWAFARYGGESGNKSGRTTHHKITLPRNQRNGDLNYMLVWTPTAANGGPALVRLTGAADATTIDDNSANNPTFRSYNVRPGATVRITARALVGTDQAPGWLECALFDRNGTLLSHGGPTDQLSGCSVKATRT